MSLTISKIAIVFIICIVVYSLIQYSLRNSDEIHNRSNLDTTFNSKIWLSANLYLRGRMVNDLIKSDILKSISTDSLKIILGDPSEIDSAFYTYIVSPTDTSLAHNYQLLHIEIDSTNNLVKDYWLTD